MNPDVSLNAFFCKWSTCQRFNLPLTVFSYDTAVEQIAVIKQIMELYLVQEDEFHHASAMLELAIALHSLGDVELEEEK